ncbi:sulfite exporter TauE/SafE family protein [Shimia thalassica]|uniref:sulfite exporter TauE/SafE family protein n=1 Tax=Shimia thalassica TaxID=1715693 RepID=UPI002734F35B|nr:sulfite exporter TauE/SafE family protein [Shimia thalassica]MDP2518795.1 sulfite exporter TauE/SafE family protein [Shimia thalassica]
MPDLLTQALALPGLPWVILAAFVAGIVRGFSGFGTALVYLPVAAQFMPPVWAILSVAAMDILGPLPNIPNAIKVGHKRDLMRLFAGVVVALPVGLWVLTSVDPDVFRYAVSILAIGMLGILGLGMRYRGQITPPMVYGIGGAGGFLGGAAGLPGPPVILFYMASPHGPSVIRANTMVFLFGYDLLLIAVLAVSSRLEPLPFVIGLVLTLPALLGNIVGGAIFNPDRERTYRAVAYVIIAMSALSGLPFWSEGGHP